MPSNHTITLQCRTPGSSQAHSCQVFCIIIGLQILLVPASRAECRQLNCDAFHCQAITCLSIREWGFGQHLEGQLCKILTLDLAKRMYAGLASSLSM